jgi:hypothetical protein
MKLKNTTIGKMHLVTTILFAFTGGLNYSMMNRAKVLGEATDSWSWLLPLLNLVGAVIFATLAHKFLTKPEEN